jgi:hypothetical protein
MFFPMGVLSTRASASIERVITSGWAAMDIDRPRIVLACRGNQGICREIEWGTVTALILAYSLFPLLPLQMFQCIPEPEVTGTNFLPSGAEPVLALSHEFKCLDIR